MSFVILLIHIAQLFVFSQALNESKKQNHNLLERFQAVQAELASGETRRAELELQARQTHKVLTEESLFNCSKTCFAV